MEWLIGITLWTGSKIANSLWDKYIIGTDNRNTRDLEIINIRLNQMNRQLNNHAPPTFDLTQSRILQLDLAKETPLQTNTILSNTVTTIQIDPKGSNLCFKETFSSSSLESSLNDSQITITAPYTENTNDTNDTKNAENENDIKISDSQFHSLLLEESTSNLESDFLIESYYPDTF